jgi:flagellar biosynthesis protein FlhB
MWESVQFVLLHYFSLELTPFLVYQVGLIIKKVQLALSNLKALSYISGFPSIFSLQEGKHCLKSFLKMVS